MEKIFIRGEGFVGFVNSDQFHASSLVPARLSHEDVFASVSISDIIGLGREREVVKNIMLFVLALWAFFSPSVGIRKQ